MKLKPDFFIISDTHFFHKNIVEYEGRPEDHTSLILENWNKVVGKNDNVLHLGDLIFANKEKSMPFLNQLNGNKYLIRGNHDSASENWYKDCGFTTVEPIYKVYHNKYGDRYNILFTHEPVLDLPLGFWNIHGHIHLGTHRPEESILSERHVNMSVEVIDYTPQRLFDILSFIKL